MKSIVRRLFVGLAALSACSVGNAMPYLKADVSSYVADNAGTLVRTSETGTPFGNHVSATTSALAGPASFNAYTEASMGVVKARIAGSSSAGGNIAGSVDTSSATRSP